MVVKFYIFLILIFNLKLYNYKIMILFE